MPPGQRLPGSRQLAGALGLNRNTTLAAYAELVAEGWLAPSAARGTFVSAELPEASPRATRVRGLRMGLGFSLGSPPRVSLEAPLKEGTLRFGSGTADLTTLPVEALARAYRRAICGADRRNLDYGDPRGHPRLREQLAVMLAAARGLAFDPSTVLVTRGSQMGLALVAQTLIEAGDVVAVEELGHARAWEAFRSAGARLVPIKVDEQGLKVEELRKLMEATSVRALYTTPHHQHPTTVTLSPGRRLSLLDLARTKRLAIIEDDYDHEFHYEARPVLPLASMDEAGVVVYLGSLSKIFAPGPRIGFIVAPKPLVERLALHRCVQDGQGDLAMEAAVAELLEDGEVFRHARRVRRLYLGRRDALVSALIKHFGTRVEFRVPSGGLAIWLRAPPGIDVEEWSRRALLAGVFVFTARHFAFDDRPRPFLRLGFSLLDETQLKEGVRRLALALPPPGRGPGSRQARQLA